ncbi:peptide deformylase [Robiginitomaculum antarcticum]|uniref:peptide deformylase n=1 Tax=Robiginitomaculum antarcticum TaxID=437507 RepID=UPI0004765884|nr:peptide deformylase [Robiginitomaculum antarcticum]
MAILPILIAPDPRLKQISDPVKTVTDETRKLMDNMLETMYDAPGIGLAAIQVGVPQQLIVMDIAEAGAPRNPQYFINPEILETVKDLKPYEEGCLSVPEYFNTIDRPERVKLTYLDYKGDRVTEWAEGLYAVCIQHEMDHLNGVLFIDYLSRLKREQALRKVRKVAKLKEAG